VNAPRRHPHAASTRGKSGARSLRLIALLVLAIAGLLALTAAPALAQKTHVLQTSFGEAGSGAGQLNLVPTFTNGVAVNDETGDVYVADNGNSRIDQFSAAGAFIRAWGWGVKDGAAEAQTCTAATTCRAAIPGTAPGQLETPVYIAIDNSGGPSQGDVYVGDFADNVITKFSATGALVEAWGETGRINGSTATDGPFESLAGLTVDSAGNLDVLAAKNFLYRYAQDGVFLNDFATPNSIYPTGLALAPTGNFFKVDGSGQAEEFGPTGTAIGGVTPHNENLLNFDVTGLAVDSASGNLFAANENFFPGGGERNPQVFGYEFNGAGEVIEPGASPCPVEPGAGCAPTEAFGLGELGKAAGIAVDSASHVLFAADPAKQRIYAYAAAVLPDVATSPVSGVKPTAATLNGTVNPAGAGPATCTFIWGTTTAYGNEAPCSESIAEGESPVAVHAELTGLQPDTTYHYRLKATNSQGTNAGEDSQDREFTTTGVGIHGESVTAVSATSATLQAQFDPHGKPTTYFFQYGPDQSYGATVPAPPGASVGSGEGDVSVNQHLQGLVAATTYHYRVVARSELAPGEFEEFFGPDHAFTTQATSSFSLPDGRQWEQVSPPDKRGNDLNLGTPQASPAGNAIVYNSTGATEPEPEGAPTGIKVLSARGSAGWSSRDLAVPHQRANGLEGEIRFFSEDLSRSIISPNLLRQGGASFNPLLSPEATEQTSYLRTNFPPGAPTTFCTASCYRPLLTGASGVADIPPGTVLVPCEHTSRPEPCEYPNFVGASADGNHVILDSVAFASGFSGGIYHVALTGTPGDEGGLYEWFDGNLTLVSVLPGNAGPASPSTDPTLDTEGNDGRSNNPGTAVSADGSRVFWSEGRNSSGSHSLYLRDLGAEETVQLDAVQGGTGTGPALPRFQIASADGSVVYFSDEQQLTPDSGAANGHPDLYRCDVVESGGEITCELSDLTPEISGAQGNFLGSVLGASRDGSSAYFVADGVFAANQVENGGGPEVAKPGDCAPLGERSEPGQSCNLYRSHNGTTTFIAILSSEDQPGWNLNPRVRPSRVSPNGEWLAFMSQRHLTGYDSTDATAGVPDQEVFLYDAGDAKLVCASCNPTGARPHGVEFAGNFVNEPPEIQGTLESFQLGLPAQQRIAASLPSWAGQGFDKRFYQPRYLGDSGRLFFNSADALLPQDSNGLADVYEYEPPTVGDCAESGPSFEVSSGGCLALISSGTSSRESMLLDASESGDDVFFLTTSQLTSTDTDSSHDVYDAHVCTAAAPCLPPPPPPPPTCEGDACQLPATPPNDATPGSLSFHGAGNVHEPSARKKKHKAKRHKKKSAHKKASKRAAGRKSGGAK